MRGKVLQKIFPALGTVNTITLYDSFASETAEQVKKRVLDLHRHFSLFEQESDISGINEQAGMKAVPVHQDTFLSFFMHWLMGGKHREQKIGIQNPFQKNGVSMADIMVKNKAVVTSGSYEQGFFFEGVRYHHIIDPRTGWPVDSGLLSVTLIGDNAMELDALATGICVMGEKNALPLLERYGIEAVFISNDGEIKITNGLQGKFFLKSN